MSAAWIWLRADLRARWRSWIVLGILAGVTVGLAAAGVAGARRTADALPRYVAASHFPTAAVLANDPSFDRTRRAEVAALPQVSATYPFLVGVALNVVQPQGFDSSLVPTTPASARLLAGVVVAGRMADPRRADEVVVDENARRTFGLEIGRSLVVEQSISPADAAGAPPGIVPTGVALHFTARLRVVGIAKSVSSDTNWTPSYGFYAKYRPRLAGFVNQFVDLRNGDAGLPRFRTDVERILGHPVNIESFQDLGGLRKAKSVTDLERSGLLLFALAVVLGGGVLVGQALVRAVTAGAADLPTWRAIGADRTIIVPALVLPAAVTAVVASTTAVIVAIAVSSRFPIGLARQYDLDVGTHADWPVLALGALAALLAVLGTAYLSARWRAMRGEAVVRSPSTAGAWAARLGLPPAFVIGSRLAVEPGRGRRAVPVRSALVGAIAGVLGVVACFTFRAGIDDAIASPRRSGIVWNYGVASGAGPLAPDVFTVLARDPHVSDVLDAVWARAVRINGVTTPSFGTTDRKGHLGLVVLDGHAPTNAHEIAFAPATLHELHLGIGDRVLLGSGHEAHSARVVGTALLPATSHTDYDQSAWMTAAGLRRALPPSAADESDSFEDYAFLRWAPGTHVAAEERKLTALGQGSDEFFADAPTLPPAVTDLGRLRSLPLTLGVFFGLLACATVAHALVTTVRRRKHDLAVFRTIGLTRRQSRVAIVWQATLLAGLGLVIGIPLGIGTGRLVWRWLADSFPVVYVPPLALVAVLAVVPVALLIANLLAAGPAHAASRIRPADALRTE